MYLIYIWNNSIDKDLTAKFIKTIDFNGVLKFISSFDVFDNVNMFLDGYKYRYDDHEYMNIVSRAVISSYKYKGVGEFMYTLLDSDNIEYYIGVTEYDEV